MAPFNLILLALSMAELGKREREKGVREGRKGEGGVPAAWLGQGLNKLSRVIDGVL